MTLYVGGSRKMGQTTIRLPVPIQKRLAAEVRKRGLPSTSALIRTAIENELEGREASLDAAEQRIAGTLERLGKEIRRVGTAQHAQFALVDALARVILLCVPEPPADVHSQALATAKQRHHKLLRAAALSMRGDARAALANLVSHGE
jgi:Arc/MetJ-type ribon-helix-helix transcriptional regulator